MSRLISEDSVSRALGRSAYGISEVVKRPAPTAPVVPYVVKSRIWGRNVTVTDGYEIDDLAHFNGAYASNDPAETYFSDFIDSSLGYSREAIEIHAAGLYLVEWGAAFGFGLSNQPQSIIVYPNITTTDLADALDTQRSVWPTANYDYITESADYAAFHSKHLGGMATYVVTDTTPRRFPLRIEGYDATANWSISFIKTAVTRLGDVGTLA